MSLTDTQCLILTQASDHPAGLAAPPATLPPAPRAAVAKALLKAGLLALAEADETADPALAWKLDGAKVLLAITEAGRAAVAAQERRQAAECAAHRLALEVERLRDEGVTGQAAMAQALTERGVPTPRGGVVWTHTTVARVVARAG